MSGDEGLRAAVLRRLAVLDEAAGRGDAAALLPVARSGISGLVGGWRLLLAAHQPDGDDRCPVCPAAWWGARRWPCPVWRMAHEKLIGVLTAAAPAPQRQRRRPEPGSAVLGRDGTVVGRVFPAPR